MGALLALFALFLLIAPSGGARTRRHRAPVPVTVILQPFLLARSVVHTVAAPVVLNAPRAVSATARVAIRGERALRAQLVDEEPAVPVAYLVPHPRKPAQPNPELSEEGDEDFPPALEPEPDAEESAEGPTVAGTRAILRHGIAYAPRRAPQSVKRAIWAANTLRRKPYLWGGGHGGFVDRGYDCSGTISFALHGAGFIGTPLASSELMRYGERGRGRWFTIYARPGHTFAVIAGLRLDTTDFNNGGSTGPRWHAEMRDTRGYAARHPVGL